VKQKEFSKPFHVNSGIKKNSILWSTEIICEEHFLFTKSFIALAFHQKFHQKIHLK